MRKILAVRLALTLALMLTLTACSVSEQKVTHQSPEPSVANQAPAINANKPNKPTDSQPVPAASVKVYLIAIEDHGKSGKSLSTGDSLVGVERTIANPEAPLKGALTELFSLKDRTYGQSGLYNALYQSNLKVDSAAIRDGKAVIHLSGNFLLGGVLDNPRVEAQIKETALQFPTIKEVEVFLNGKRIEDALSLK